MLSGSTSNSSFFFIENVFYSDMRDPEAVDYSRFLLHQIWYWRIYIVYWSLYHQQSSRSVSHKFIIVSWLILYSIISICIFYPILLIFLKLIYKSDVCRGIIDWVDEGERYTEVGLGIYKSCAMENTTFNEINVRIGVPYLYVHRGSCQHLITVTQLRLSHDLDNSNLNDYPLRIFQSKVKSRKCRICDLSPAKYNHSSFCP